MCSIGPSCKIMGADNLVEVIHHLVGEFGSEEGNSGPIIEQVPSFVGQGFKFGNESIDFPWGEGEMTEFFLCALRGTSVLEGPKPSWHLEDMVHSRFYAHGELIADSNCLRVGNISTQSSTTP